MSMDKTHAERTHVRVAPVDPRHPIGICPPQMEGDTGYDLIAATTVSIGPMVAADIPVNVRLQLPPGFCVDIRNRSSMAKRGLYVDQNLIDEGYRGPLFVMVRNMTLPQMRALSDAEVMGVMGLSPASALVIPGNVQPTRPAHTGPNVAQMPAEADPGTVVIQAGERIAQLVFHRSQSVWVDVVPDISSDTERGERGFGSTGL